jgi:hypothetical protein
VIFPPSATRLVRIVWVNRLDRSHAPQVTRAMKWWMQRSQQAKVLVIIICLILVVGQIRDQVSGNVVLGALVFGYVAIYLLNRRERGERTGTSSSRGDAGDLGPCRPSLDMASLCRLTFVGGQIQ